MSDTIEEWHNQKEAFCNRFDSCGHHCIYWELGNPKNICNYEKYNPKLDLKGSEKNE